MAWEKKVAICPIHLMNIKAVARATGLSALTYWRRGECPSWQKNPWRRNLRKPTGEVGRQTDMTAPRRILPNAYWFISRRCTQRQFLLRPDGLTNRIVSYCLADAAARFNIGVLSVMVMSNHYHGVFHDRDGRLPEFLGHFHKMVAKALNCKWHRSENLWSSDSTSTIPCDEPDELMRAIVYTLNNPVKAQLVDKVSNWPGFHSYGHQLSGGAIRCVRPKCFFAQDGRMPAEVALRFSPPEIFRHLTHEKWAAKLAGAIVAEEERAATIRRQKGGRVLGRRAILRQRPTETPTTTTARTSRDQPTHPSRWYGEEALRRSKAFLQQYYQAWAKLRDGMRDVVFPAGTYLLRVRRLVNCHAPPDDWLTSCPKPVR